jgi:acyl dehydratase
MSNRICYFEDLQPGWSEASGPYSVPRDEMIAFAQRWDPRPMHLDDAAACAAGFDAAIASGAYVMAVRSSLVHGRKAELALVAGLGSEALELPNPVYAGDRLTLHSEVIEARASRSKPDRGVIRMRDVIRNQDGLPILELVSKMMVRRR